MIHLPALIDAVLQMLSGLGAHHFHWGTLGKHLTEVWTHHWTITIRWRG